MIRLFKVFCSPFATDHVHKVLESGYLGQGPRTEDFEHALEVLLVEKRIFATSSGTAALDLAYHLCGIEPGAEVISTPMTCTATNIPLLQRHAKIIWADIDPATGLINPADVLRKITQNTRAVVACDWGGTPCDYKGLKACSGGRVPVIQDGAHSLLNGAVEGGTYRMWSFQAIKHLTTGDGGALAVPRDQQERCELLRWYGLDRRKGFSFRCTQDITEPGYKYGMNDVAAAIGLSNISHAERIVAAHQENAKAYCRAFVDLDPELIKVPMFNFDSSYWLFTILVEHRAEFIKYMAENGVEVSPVHDRNDGKTCFKRFKTTLPGVNFFSARNVAIPCGWWVEKEEREKIINLVMEWKKPS